MDKNIIKSDDTEIEKYKFHQHKNPINKMIVSNKVPFGKKYFKHFIQFFNFLT